MTTEAGKRFMERIASVPSEAADPTEEWVARAYEFRNVVEGAIAAIEAEARAAALAEHRCATSVTAAYEKGRKDALAEAAERVRGLPKAIVHPHPASDGIVMVDRGAVLAILGEKPIVPPVDIKP